MIKWGSSQGCELLIALSHLPSHINFRLKLLISQVCWDFDGDYVGIFRSSKKVLIPSQC